MCNWVTEPRTWRADSTTALYKGLEHLLTLKSAGILESSPVDTEVQLYIQNHNITLILNITEIILVFPFLCLLSRTATWLPLSLIYLLFWQVPLACHQCLVTISVPHMQMVCSPCLDFDTQVQAASSWLWYSMLAAFSPNVLDRHSPPSTWAVNSCAVPSSLVQVVSTYRDPT